MSNPDGSWVRDWRHRHGYRQEDLARELEVARQTVVNWEKAAAVDRVLRLALIALEISPSLQQIVARE